MHVRKNLDCLQEIIDRNMNVEGDSDEASDKNEKHVFENWRKVNPKVAKTLAELCSSVLWKISKW